jgi:two-component system sensor histidine kinase BaeS
MRTRRVPWRRSLVVRLLATSVLVAVCAIVATAWLAVQSTTRAIQQEQGRSLSDDTKIYDELLGYAATHQDWTAVNDVVTTLAAKTARRITLMTDDRQTIVDSAPGPSLLAARPSATVDALRVDTALTGADAADRIDPRAVGPYRLTADEHQVVTSYAADAVACMNKVGSKIAEVVDGPDGRPTVKVNGSVAPEYVAFCKTNSGLAKPMRTEFTQLDKLRKLTAKCLGVKADEVFVDLGFTVDYRLRVEGAPSESKVRACVDKSRLAQLKPYVAPPALLFVTDPADGTADPVFNLSRANTMRIAGVTGLVLALAIAITVLVGVRLVRPLRALTEAASRPVEEQRRVPVTTHDEIGYLATALNDLSDRRERTELQRKAMVSDVAHELRTPLTNIRSWLEAAQDGLAAVDPQLLTLLLEEAVLLQHVIDDLRDLAAADAGSLRLHTEPTFVNDALEQAAEAHRGAAEGAGVRLTTDSAADPEVVVDPVRLRQLVGNLVSNAVRHTPGGGSVTIRSRMDDAWLTIEVVDTGVGIAPDDLPKVFDRFWRADGSRSRATGGSGLGLAITRKLTEAHGGDIAVQSRPGKGTVFTVRLPIVAPATVPQQRAKGRHGAAVAR